MSDRMYSLPFEHLMKWLLGERHGKTVYGVHHLYKADPSRTYTIFGRKLETPFGPAAGPHNWPRISPQPMRQAPVSLNSRLCRLSMGKTCR